MLPQCYAAPPPLIVAVWSQSSATGLPFVIQRGEQNLFFEASQILTRKYFSLQPFNLIPPFRCTSKTCAIIFATKASPAKMKIKMIVPCRRSHSNPAKTLPPSFINDGVFSHKTPFWQKIMVSMKLMVDLTLSHVYRGKYIFETVFT